MRHDRRGLEGASGTPRDDDCHVRGLTVAADRHGGIRHAHLLDGERVIGERDPIVEGSGKTLLSGLIDSHTHICGDALAQGLVFGVTTELDMFTDPTLADCRDNYTPTEPLHCAGQQGRAGDGGNLREPGNEGGLPGSLLHMPTG